MAFVAEPVDRTGTGSLQDALTPQPIRDVGYASLGGAEFDFKTAPCIRQALAAYAEGGCYDFNWPIDGYRERVAWWMANARDWAIDGQWVVPTMGTIFSVATCIRMCLGPDDAMITQPPVYYRYEQAATRMGLRTVHNPLLLDGDRYTMDLDGLEHLMANPHNKLLVVCNPANPVGRVWTREELMAVSELSARYGTIVVSDEIFAEDVFDGHRTTPYASLEPGCANAITLTSLGKCFSCTGLNFANAIVPDTALRDRFEKRRTADHFGSIDPFGRTALMAAYTPEGLAWQRDTLPYLAQNRRIVAEALEGAHLARVFPTEGTFVCWVRWDGLPLPGSKINAFLEQRALVEIEPGPEYGEGLQRFSRINLGAIHAQTQAAMGRIVSAAAALPASKPAPHR